MNPKGKKILCVLPAYNEEGKIGRVVKKVKKEDGIDTILVVDDFSSDKTSQEAKTQGALVLRHKMNLGVGAAIRSGIDYAIANDFDIVVILSGDDQHDSQDIPSVLSPLLNDGYHFVQGSRRLKGGRIVGGSLFRRFATKLYAVIFRFFTGFPSTDATNGFRAFYVSIFKEGRINLWQDWLDRYELEPFMLFKVAVDKNMKMREVPITLIYHNHAGGYTKMKFFLDWWRLFRPMIYLKLRMKK
jgi:dolichol-phosphate mannosyltransferase